MYNDREAMKRQSTVLLADAAADDRLTKALLQIELLSNELETVRQQDKEKVSLHIHCPHCLRRAIFPLVTLTLTR